MQDMISKVSVIIAASMMTAVTPAAAQNTSANQNQVAGSNQQAERQTADRASGSAQVSDGQPGSSQPAGAPQQSAQSGSGQTQAHSERFIDHTVVNQQGQRLGTVELLWEDASNQPAYLGIKRPAQDQLIVVPAENAQVNEARNMIRVILSTEALQSAPTLAKDGELTDQIRQRVDSFYEQQALARAQAQESQPAQGADQGRLTTADRPDQPQEPRAQAQETQPSQSADQGRLAATDRTQAQEQDQATIRLKEEQATIGKRTVEYGGVLLRKVVRTETNRAPVTLKREELVIERIPGGGEKAATVQFGEDEIFIPLRREVPVVQKDVVVKETVRVGKDVQERKTNVTTRLREEELRIQRQGQQEATGVPGSVSTGRGTAAGSATGSEQRQSESETESDRNPEER